MKHKTKQGDAMMITIIVIAVIAVGIIGYLIYDSNQKQAAAEAEIAAAQQQAAQAEAQAKQAEAQKAAQAEAAQATADAVKTEIANTANEVQQQVQNMTCEEKLASAQKNLPLLEDYVKTLEQGAELIEENPDEAIEQCRETHENLSKPECETKIKNYIDGKTEVYEEAKEEIKEAEAIIAAGC